MPRLTNTGGVVVNVSDDTAGQLGRMGWQTVSGGYDDQTVPELKDEIRDRNADRDEDDHLVLTGTKAELIDVLTTDDQ